MSWISMLDPPRTVAAAIALVLGAILLHFRIGWRWDVVAGLVLVLSAAYAVGISPPGNLPGLLSTRIADAVDFSLSTPGLALLAAAVGFIALRRSGKPGGWDIVLGLAVFLAVYAVWSSAPNLGALSTIFSTNPWLFATLLILLLFRQSVREVVGALAKRFEAGSVDLSIGQVVQIKIEEPSITDAAPSALPFSRSPFEIESESVVDESRIRFDLSPQIQLLVTDIVAVLWSNEQANQPHRDTLDKARDGLKASRGHSSVRISLDKFVVAIRGCRFLKCNDLLRLRGASRELNAILTEIETKKPVSQLNDDDRLILHCLGIANALDERWSVACTLLAPLVDELKYLPAADTYLACTFNAYIKEQTTDLDAGEFLTWFSNTWVAQAESLLDDCEKSDWTKFPDNSKGFHMRELYKVLGNIHSNVAENLSKQGFYEAAEEYLTKCTHSINGENGSALDHNNLADLYRKRGRYDERCLTEAHRELNKAFPRSGDASDPDVYYAFYYTRAEILRAQGRLWEGVEALNGYTEARARKDGEIRGYISNQILAAKLVAEDSSLGRWKLALSIDILERAKAFLDREKAQVRAEQRRSLECELGELIGIAYLELPHCEEKSISVLKDSLGVCADNQSEAQWKRTVALARAHVRHARSLRQRTSILEADRHGREAERWLEDSDSKLRAFPVRDISPGRAARRFRLHFDALIANQELGEELFQQGAVEAAQARLDGTVVNLLRVLSDFLESDQAREALAGGLAEMRTKLKLYRAYREFLLGRILVRVAPDLAEVRAAFRQCRNVEGMLTPWVDVELGNFLLSAAAKNKDMTLYDEAIVCLGSAASADHLSPRREAVRILTLAYARRPQLRKQK